MIDDEYTLNEQEIIDLDSPEESNSLYVKGNEITNQLIQEEDPQKIEDLTNLFKANQTKKDIARINKLSNLLELVDDEVITRFTSEPETFDHDQVIKLMTTTQKSIDSMNNSLNQIPVIQINNQKNEININNETSGLDLASRKRVIDAVKAILTSVENNDEDTDEEE